MHFEINELSIRVNRDFSRISQGGVGAYTAIEKINKELEAGIKHVNQSLKILSANDPRYSAFQDDRAHLFALQDELKRLQVSIDASYLKNL